MGTSRTLCPSNIPGLGLQSEGDQVLSPNQVDQVQSMDTSELALLVDNRERSTLRSVLYYTVKTCF